MPYGFVQSDNQVVEAWTSWHLHFRDRSNTEEDDRYREELQRRLGQLTPGAGLRATYTCQHWPPRCDLENLLLYNVSQSGKPFGKRGFLLFEKRIGKLSVPNAAAHIRYEVVGEHGVTPPESRMLAECVTSPCHKVNFGNGAGPLWKVFRAATWRTGEAVWDGHSDFEVHLVVRGPSSFNVVKPESVKKIVDGFLSALHHRCETDTDLDEVVARALCADQTEWHQGVPWDRDEMRRLLLEKKCAVLGPHNVPKCYLANSQTSLQWNPKDHLLARCQIVHEASPAWTFSGSLYM